jgi:hypothetical protein
MKSVSIVEEGKPGGGVSLGVNPHFLTKKKGFEIEWVK